MAERRRHALRAFLGSEAGGGLLLMAAAAFALLVANSPAALLYGAILHAPLGPMEVSHWINDGLMALFFLLVGLEVKRELVAGHLARPADRVLPVAAALGGMAVPALVYLAAGGATPVLARGWAIPTATDIAFACGVLALVGRGVPGGLRLFLTSVAIVDDIGAVLIIAIFYSAGLDPVALAAAAVIWGAMLLLGRRGVAALWPYLLLAAGLWVTIHASGVHATVAGVLAAFAVPMRAADGSAPLERLEHGLAPWVAFLIVPLFGFANAGLSLDGLGAGALLGEPTLGILLGLVIGKPVGVLAGVALARRLGAAPPPGSAMQLLGVALLCGIGFTMSLFIGGLAFADPAGEGAVKLGVLAGSLVAGLAGYAALRSARA